MSMLRTDDRIEFQRVGYSPWAGENVSLSLFISSLTLFLSSLVAHVGHSLWHGNQVVRMSGPNVAEGIQGTVMVIKILFS